SSAELQKLLSASETPAIRRLRADRLYFAYENEKPDGTGRITGIRCLIVGVRIGGGMLDLEDVKKLCQKTWPTVLGGADPIRITPEFGIGLPEPFGRMQAIVATKPVLDGVRVESGAEFGPTGDLLLAGIQPGMTPAAEKELKATYQAVLQELIDKADANKEGYERLAKGGVSAQRMKLVQTRRLLSELREWAANELDDVRMPRLYFDATGVLTLQCQTVKKEDAEKVNAKFKKLSEEFFPAEPKPELPAPEALKPDSSQPPLVGTLAGRKQPTSPSAKPPELKIELGTPPLPGLTAEIRRRVAEDQRKPKDKQLWSGVLIERGYFDESNRYTLRGVVDTSAQNEALGKLLDELKTDARWSAYFSPAPNKPALTVIPMSELLDRVRRVTPAYPEFDGVRLETARYDEEVNLIFDAHIVGKIDPAAEPLLKELIEKHERYRRRIPPGKQVQIKLAEGVAYRDDQIANFSLGYGAKLLADGNMEKAKQWLDVGLLHYPNESGVWFLSAYYHHLTGDKELVLRDLHRLIELEGPLAFNGPAQRKRRYEAAKDIQGTKRNQLEALWLERFREIKDGTKPMTMTLSAPK
ncbi:MAG: hypothetical protein L0241_01635, partial [Planctomycetia bacterium]|nr:hypothetical protein [Planctomycetia bacterium]